MRETEVLSRQKTWKMKAAQGMDDWGVESEGVSVAGEAGPGLDEHADAGERGPSPVQVLGGGGSGRSSEVQVNGYSCQPAASGRDPVALIYSRSHCCARAVDGLFPRAGALRRASRKTEELQDAGVRRRLGLIYSGTRLPGSRTRCRAEKACCQTSSSTTLRFSTNCALEPCAPLWGIKGQGQRPSATRDTWGTLFLLLKMCVLDLKEGVLCQGL